MIPAIPDLEMLAAGPFTMEQLVVVWHDDRSAPPAHVAQFLADRWAAHTAGADGRRLFNAPITQLRSFDYSPAAGSATRATLTLRLAPTDYRSFLISCYRDRPWFDAHAPNWITPALGNSVLLTDKEHALLGIRSHRVAAYPGRAHVFGGVLDPLEPAARNPAGLLAHLHTELAEELRLTPTELPGTPRILALVRDTHLAQPELIWHWRITTDLATLAHRLDPAEHDSALLLPRHAAGELDRLTPVTRAAFELWLAS